ASLRRFVDWVATYTLSPPGAVLRMAMSAPSALEPMTPQAGWKRAPLPVEDVRITPERDRVRITPERDRVLSLLGDGVVKSGAALADEAKVGAGVVRGLANAGLIVPALLPRGAEFQPPDADSEGPALSVEQAHAAATLRGAVHERKYGVTLLTGVTGSG